MPKPVRKPRAAPKDKSTKGHHTVGGRARSPSQKGSSDEESSPSLSDVLNMPKFSGLEILASDESVQEVLEEGDW